MKGALLIVFAAAGAIVPGASARQATAHPLAAGLIRPTALAVGHDGSLLIVDQDRDEVLRRAPDGRLSVFAASVHLDASSALAVAANGTVYVSDTGHNRVLAVAPDGTRRTLVHVKQPGGLAAGSDGSVYVATPTGIQKIDPRGHATTFAAGRPPYGDLTVGGKTFAFWPGPLALDGDGDLYAFSFDTKTIVEFSPTGRPLRASQDYANGLATAPDGSVLVAEHGAALQRLARGRLTRVLDFESTAIPGYGRGFEPEGIAVAADGTAYLDTYVGDGWGDETALVQISPRLRTSIVRITTPATATFDTRGFPASVYPEPRGGCPSPAGLTAFTPRAKGAAVTEAQSLDISFPMGLLFSDRAWWTGLYADWIDGRYDVGQHAVTHVGPAADDAGAAAIAAACGADLVRHSLAVVIGPSEYSDQVSHLFFLDRYGHALVYRQHT